LDLILDSRFEIISADSMQVYRGMDIGTAKPSMAERARIPHHLIDVVDPCEQYNAGRFVKDAEALIRDVHARGRIPVVSGGTAFYITSLVYGLPEAPPGDPKTRERLRFLQERDGQDALYALLRERDPAAAARIQPRDRYRTLRALEVLESTQRSLFAFGWPRTPRTDMRLLLLGLERPRAELYRRIDARVARMFEKGLVDEVKRLLAAGYRASHPGMRGIGYRQLLEIRAGCETLRLVRDRIAADTRRYAKRQITFFRSVPGVAWVGMDRPAETATRIEAFVRDVPAASGP
jgi:tRNA dimethylallyltransferase